MIGILVITHKKLGDALVEAAEFIIGSQSEAIEAISIDINEDPEKLRKKITQ